MAQATLPVYQAPARPRVDCQPPIGRNHDGSVPALRQRSPEPARCDVRLLLQESGLSCCPMVDALRTARPHRPVRRDFDRIPGVFRQSLFCPEHRNPPGLFHTELLVASEPKAFSLPQDAVHRLACQLRGQSIGTRRKGGVGAAVRLVKAGRRSDQHTSARPVRPIPRIARNRFPSKRNILAQVLAHSAPSDARNSPWTSVEHGSPSACPINRKRVPS